MSCRTLTLGLLAVATAFSVSCVIPPMDQPQEFAAIPGIGEGQTPDEVIKVLGHPTVRENGWWNGTDWYDMEFHVWYYKKVGRVVFNRNRVVHTSEADPQQLGRTDQHPASTPLSR
ncbi:MAG TPA: hypothetical protein VJB14_15220 [Planctomycetota bacterium]|nr:hypothetical protein [Planctomycetota bacterium]